MTRVNPRRGHRPGMRGPLVQLPIGVASNTPTPPEPYDDHIAQLTTLATNDRCDECPWPELCERDRTCWNTETHADWQRTRLEQRKGRPYSDWTEERLLQWVHDFVTEQGRVPHAVDVKWAGAPKYDTLQKFGYPNMAALVTKAGYEPHKRKRWNKR